MAQIMPFRYTEPMRWLSLVAVLAAFLLIGAMLKPAQTLPRNEDEQIRGIWVDGFHAGIKSRAEVDALIARVQKAKLNTIFAQVRKRGDAYYASRYEPRAKDISDSRYDPLAYLIEKAHAASPRINVHAWINMGMVGSSNDPAHILTKHPEYQSLSDTGAKDDEGIKVDPGVPGAADWTFRVYMDVARRYDVDGIHFDFVRYGGAHWGYAPESVARYNRLRKQTGQPRFDDAGWQQWRRDQVTALVRKVYASAAALKPNLVVSAATIAWGDAPRDDAAWTRSSAYSAVYQDWRGWLEEGILDIACPMTYFRATPNRAFQENWATWIRGHQYDRAATMATASYLNPLPDTLALMDASLATDDKGRRPAGIVLYSYHGTSSEASADPESFFTAVGERFGKDAPSPSLPWKQKPTEGIIKGTVLTGTNLVPADGADVTITVVGGKKPPLILTADGTGFYAGVRLLPGEYDVTVGHNGEASAPQRVRVEAGQVHTADFLLSAGELPEPRPVYGIGNEKDGAHVFLQNRLVTVGTDALGGQRCYLGDVPGGGYVDARFSQTPDLPFVAGDRITLLGTIRKEGGKTVIAVETARMVGIADPE
jgi:uncharacterized lipoprotein YddW (UPF0748 family)